MLLQFWFMPKIKQVYFYLNSLNNKFNSLSLTKELIKAFLLFLAGFISLDCGLPDNTTYIESTTGINYISDAAYIQTGIGKSILPEFQTGLPRQTWHLRSFPKGDRNCYNLSLRKGDEYLIRATFVYGNYDEMNKPPKFDFHLGPNLWTSVTIQNASVVISMEIIHVIQSNRLFVCLVNTGNGIPFVSALELRLLNNATYRTQIGSLQLFTRLDVCSTTGSTFRFKEDIYDREWWPYNRNDWTPVTTSYTVTAGSNLYQPPSLAMRTACIPVNSSQSLVFSIDPSSVPNAEFYLYMHFAEVQQLQANESRKFNISYNGQFWFGPVIPFYLASTTVFTRSALTGGDYQFSIYRTADSTLPPILNAIEIYTVKSFVQYETIETEIMYDIIVDAISNIKSIYGLQRNWQGDPCVPEAYSWDGLNCSYNGYNPPRIISLNLSSSGLNGEIPPYIISLTQLQYLDLSNNSLTGPVPEFLSQLQSLTVLNLDGNMLNGTIPSALIERSKNGLQLSIDGNPNLCVSLPCKKNKKKNVVVPIAASVASFSVLIIVLATIWRLLKRRQPPLGMTSITKLFSTDLCLLNLLSDGNTDDESNTLFQSLELKNRRFKFSEVQTMTNDFKRVLGTGGFGNVFYGNIDDTEVAVKMLSLSSSQGYKQFEAEVKTLFRVHHANLTSLIGYCNEGANLGLIYEYMAKGNLAEFLSGISTRILKWEERVRIALEAGQGLEYLHEGCRPPIIHRDVKSSNILLNEDFQAKLADFGLSKTFPIEGGSHISASVAGTTGYLDPEYRTSFILTKKSDVYSFGVVLLEIITGKPAVINAQTNNVRTHISKWVSSILSRGDIRSIVDQRLDGDFDVNSAWKAVEVAMLCVSHNSTRRPTMNEVVLELSQCLSAERARTTGEHGNKSKNPVDMMTMSLSTEIGPVPR
ncbi:LRR receptor-like serine/threonine-protein kinase IOS1 [Durio zibethinus]|uniref:non-specific serine/threonine protein kinase n=1 Tax=Durio zibethinus TaxID=66656 RepID=A0A6P5WF86_DURZI|nr:LRR receptor-like serine/threonine-protein kinase IOS1 [Durio zibethinus]